MHPPSEVRDNDREISDFLDHVRAHSLYYQGLWNDVKLSEPANLKDLPLVNHTSFWAANSIANNTVLTASQKDGIVMKTGGTTGEPKLSFWTNEEFRDIAKSLALCLKKSGVAPGHRVANLFYAGDLYGSFLLHILSVYEAGAGIQLPIAGHIEPEAMLHHITDLQSQVILSTVTTMSKLAATLRQQNKKLAFVEKLLFSGEALYEDQVSLLRDAFPNASIRSLIYGTMECGVIGYPTAEEDTSIHQLLPRMILEIVTENGVTTNSGEPGELVVTNLGRRLMPIVRYSCGDRGEWVDYDKGLFRLLGRQSKSVRLGPVSFDISHIKQCIKHVLGQYEGMQAVLRRFDSKDQLIVRIAAHGRDEKNLGPEIIEEMGRARPMLKDHIQLGLVSPVLVEFVPYSDLVVNRRSGKALEILDERLSGNSVVNGERSTAPTKV